MACSEQGSVQLSPVMETVVRALLREPEGLSMYQLFERTRTASPNSLRTNICFLRKRLNRIGWNIKMLSYARNYILKPLEK